MRENDHSLNRRPDNKDGLTLFSTRANGCLVSVRKADVMVIAEATKEDGKGDALLYIREVAEPIRTRNTFDQACNKVYGGEWTDKT